MSPVEQSITGTAGIVHCGHVWREMLNGGSWPWSCLVCGARRHLDGRVRGWLET